MPTNTYVALDKVTVGTATPSITFSSIPATYTDLVVVANFGKSADVAIKFRVNGDTGSNYSLTALYGDGSATSSFRSSNVTFGEFSYFPSTSALGTALLSFQNYSNTTTNKTVLARSGEASSSTWAYVNLWRSTAAINSITLLPNSSANFNVGSTFSLYGIAASSVGAKATGGDIYSDSQYFYHVFDASGTFTPTQSITADCLVVAGGGGGGATVGGGGGAGGLLAFTSQSLTATGYTVTVGAGGAGGTSVADGTTGADSRFGALTLVKGGGGGGGFSATNGKNGLTGGSGGGAGGTNAGTAGTGGSATSGQGFAGGSGGNVQTSGAFYTAGGGGGAGAVGANAVNNVSAGTGGIGSSTYSSWGVATGIGQNVSGTYYLAGGGAGALSVGAATAGGLGGGGNGGSNTPATSAVAGMAYTGGGGGGQRDSNSGAGAAGGSGVVIVRYLKA